MNSWFVSGLVEGEGCFCVTISKHKTKKSGFDPRLMFEIEMVAEDKPLLEQVRDKLGCGQLYQLNYERYGWRPHVKFAVKNRHDLAKKIIPFFLKHPLQGKKRKDFELFRKALKVFESNLHLTNLGINQLRDIQSRMNLRSKKKWSSAMVRENRVPSGN